jgi:hypothetical protein
MSGSALPSATEHRFKKVTIILTTGNKATKTAASPRMRGLILLLMLRPFGTIRIIRFPLLGIFKHLIGLAQILKLLLRSGILIHVRMISPSPLTILLLDRRLISALRHPQVFCSNLRLPSMTLMLM